MKSKLLATVLGIALLVASAVYPQRGTIPLVPLEPTTTSAIPTGGSFLSVWSYDRALTWASGYCYGVAAVAFLLSDVDAATATRIVAATTALEARGVANAEMLLSLGYDTPSFPWYVTPFAALAPSTWKGEQDE